MTFRELHDMMSQFVRDNPDHEALDQHVVVRILIDDEPHGEELHCGGLRTVTVDAGCTETFVLVLDADQETDS